MLPIDFCHWKYIFFCSEYAIDGIFSIKSDVFSYGILFLEIVSGKKNSRVFYTNDYNNSIAQVSDITSFFFL